MHFSPKLHGELIISTGEEKGKGSSKRNTKGRERRESRCQGERRPAGTGRMGRVWERPQGRLERAQKFMSHIFTALRHRRLDASSLVGLTLALSTQERRQKVRIKPQIEASDLLVSRWSFQLLRHKKKHKLWEKMKLREK